MTNTPVVMSISNHDPSGSAGISADIETLASLGCHCTPIISRLCARDTAGVKDSQITDTSLLIEQIRAVLEDINVNLFCIGDLASISNTEAVHTILNDYSDIAVVLHPATSEHSYNPGLEEAFQALLLPLADITIMHEAKALAMAPGADTLPACACELMESGCEHLLITGINGNASKIRNHWFFRHGSSQQYEWKRLPHSYHGAGDTLSAAISAYLAHDLSMAESIQQAQQFTWQALNKGRRFGMGELVPDRMHWCRN
jgi:hydroxymethylpyrimidine/phosphomethylpyrimidine kinase